MSAEPASTTAPTSEAASRASADANPKKATDTKRVLACGTCRKRKLKCDSKRPKCSTCARLGHPCEYDEVRKKSGPKRGYVKSLEARLNQLESLLDGNATGARESASENATAPESISTDVRNVQSFPSAAKPDNANTDTEIFPATTINDSDLNMLQDFGLPVEGFSWDMVSLGLEEPLPSQEVMDDLYQIYFTKVHPSMPMLHRTRFLTSLNMAPNSRPPVCLRYIIFAHACSVETRYIASAEQFYIKARKYIEQDEMRGHGEPFTTVAHAQSWSLIATYEFRYMYFPRAWLSVGRAGRLVQLLGLHRQDRVAFDVKQTLPPPRDWTEKEERRRTFWQAYCQDRYASIGTGWPMMFDENDILTALPASEQAFLAGRAEKTPMLEEVMAGEKTAGLSAIGSVILLATLFGRNLIHLHRPSADDNDSELNGEFWKRHRSLDNILLNISLSLPAHLRLPHGVNDPNIVFCNMAIHTSAICLHQAAIFKADKHKLSGQISAESKRRCLVAADQVTNIMKMISYQDLTSVNPFLAFSLYVAARVFVQYLKFKKDDHTVKMSLMFLLHAMQALKVKNPLTESFLVQLDVDLEGSGIDVPSPMGTTKSTQKAKGESPGNSDTVRGCSLTEYREPQPYSEQRSRETHFNPPGAASFRSSEFDSNSYFAPSNSDNNSFQPGQVLNNLTPSSTTQSNHPTPSGPANPGRASSAGTSPQSDGASHTVNKISVASYRDAEPERFKIYMSSAAEGAGVVTERFNMNMDENDDMASHPHPRSNQHQNQKQGQNRNLSNPPPRVQSQSPQSPTDFSAMDFNMNIDMNAHPSGFTPAANSNGPEPSGFSPGATGFTPGRYDMNSDRFNLNLGQNGVGMGDFGMSPIGQWQGEGSNMNNLTNDNDQWIFNVNESMNNQ